MIDGQYEVNDSKEVGEEARSGHKEDRVVLRANVRTIRIESLSWSPDSHRALHPPHSERSASLSALGVSWYPQVEVSQIRTWRTMRPGRCALALTTGVMSTINPSPSDD